MRRFATMLLALVLGVGCTLGAEATSTSEALSGSVGILHVERENRLDAPDTDGRTALRATFARHHGVDAESVMSWMGNASPATEDRCILLNPSLGADAGATEELIAVGADVELVDVGLLSVAVGGSEVLLSPRTFPDLASVLAGVFYADDEMLMIPRAEVDEYVFSAEGSPDVGSFEARVLAPAAPTGLIVLADANRPVDLDAEIASVDRNGGLELFWNARDMGDSVEVELISEGRTLSCLSSDNGSLQIPTSALQRLPASDTVQVNVRRVRLQPFEAEGMDEAYARVAATTIGQLELH